MFYVFGLSTKKAKDLKECNRCVWRERTDDSEPVACTVLTVAVYRMNGVGCRRLAVPISVYLLLTLIAVLSPNAANGMSIPVPSYIGCVGLGVVAAVDSSSHTPYPDRTALHCTDGSVRYDTICYCLFVCLIDS